MSGANSLIESMMGGEPVDWPALMGQIPVGEEDAIRLWATGELEALPTPLSPKTADAHAPQRRVLERLLAELDARAGDPEPLIEVLRHSHVQDGQPALELIRLLMQQGYDMQAWVVAELAILAGTDDPPTIRAIQATLAGVPEGWTQAVQQLGPQPTREAWMSLMAFVPEDNLFFTNKLTIQLLIDLGADPNAVFEAAAPDGATSALIELVDTGLVDPSVVVRHAERAVLKSYWIALAARAACERGEIETCVELAARAMRMPGDPSLAAFQLAALWLRASDLLRDQLREVGLNVVVDGCLGGQ